MEKQEALETLGLDADATQAQIRAALEEKQATLAQKREAAPTEALKKKFDELESRLQQAREVLLESGSGEQPTPGRGPSLSATKMADLPSAGPAEQTGGLLKPGQTLAGRYQVREQIGSGGMGAVYHALDTTRDEDVALKVLLPSLVDKERARQRFMDEARLSSKLSHPNIVNVYDVQQDGDYVFLSMELLDGQDLRGLMDTRALARQPFEEDEARQLASALCDALQYAHQHTVHRDIKPENVWVTEDGQYKIMDFGIARVMSNSQRTQTGMAMGTAYYMAPEQLKGTAKVDGRADQYALGVLLYELLTGEVPAGRIQPLREQRKDLSRGFAAAVDKALEPKPENRHADMAAFAAALSGKGGPALPAFSGKAAGIAASVVLAILLLGGGGWAVSSGAVGTGWLARLLPDPEAESRALGLDGEIDTLEQRLEARQRSFGQELSDAERQVDSLERDLRNARGEQEGEDLEAELKTAREQLRRTEVLVELGRAAIFESDLFTDTAAQRRIGEEALRNDNFSEAETALAQAKTGLNTLLERAGALPDLIPVRAEARGHRQIWESAAREAELTEDAVARRIRESFRQAENQTQAGDFRTATTSYRTAADLARDATAFASAKQNDTVASVADYATEHPGGAYVQAAEQLAWTRAGEQDSAAAYGAYLEGFPEGPNAARAREREQALAEAAAEARRQRELTRQRRAAESVVTVEDAREFLEQYPTGPVAEEVRNREYPLLVRERETSKYDDGRETESVTTYSYNAAGRRTREETEFSDSEGRDFKSFRTYEYDSVGRLAEEYYKRRMSGNRWWRQRYEYDEAGNRVATHRTENDGDTWRTRYKYENGRRVERQKYDNGKLFSDTQYSYNQKGQLISQKSVWKNVSRTDKTTYEYDDAGNRVSEY